MRVGEANQSPRRWTDGSGRVRVIEGWHPSEPSRLGYNLVVDGDWIGTFGTLDGAAEEAVAYVRWRGSEIRDKKVVLRPYGGPRRPRGRLSESRLRLVKPDDDTPD